MSPDGRRRSAPAGRRLAAEVDELASRRSRTEAAAVLHLRALFSIFYPPPSASLSPLDDRYAALWAGSPGRTPFSHPVAVAAYARAFGLPARVVMLDDQTAALPIFRKRRGPFRAAALPPLCPVLRPLLAQPLGEAASHARASPLDRLLARLDGQADQLTLALGDDDLRPYLWAGWTATPRATYRLDLGGNLRAGYSSSVRRALRSEADAFEIIEDDALAPQAVGLMAASYRRGGADLGLDERAVAELADALSEAGLARTFAARRGGSVEAAVTVATDGRTAFYWIAGGRPGPAMTVLVDHVLGRLASDGVGTFDFCGANVPSIAEFKRRFGPVLAPAPLVRRVTHPALRLLDRFR